MFSRFLKYLSLLIFSFLFLAALSTQKVSADTCTPVFPATTCSVSGDVTITATVPDTTVTFSGYASAGSVVFFKENNVIVGTVVTSSNGTFSKSVVSTPGSHTSSVYLTDSSGLTTPEITLPSVNLSIQMDSLIGNIHLPPTISITKTKISQGQIVSIFGKASPGALVDIYVNDVKKFSATVGSDSSWKFDLNGSGIPDQASFYAISTRAGLPNSEKSQIVNLEVLACSDFDCNRSTSGPSSSQTPNVATTPAKAANVTYKINFGNLSFGVIWLIIIIFLLLIFVIFLLLVIILLLRRRRKEKEEASSEVVPKPSDS